MTVKSAELKAQKRNALEVSTPETTYLMYADTEKEKDDWIGESSALIAFQASAAQVPLLWCIVKLNLFILQGPSGGLLSRAQRRTHRSISMTARRIATTTRRVRYMYRTARLCMRRHASLVIENAGRPGQHAPAAFLYLGASTSMKRDDLGSTVATSTSAEIPIVVLTCTPCT
jgi:hypothetical protein